MALTSWKAFQFFESSEVKLEDETCQDLFASGRATCICAGSGNLYAADQNGHVHIISKTFSVVKSFKAHDAGSILHMKRVEGTSLLLTISEDMSSEPELKVWALDKTEKKTGAPRCLSILMIQNQRKSFPISAFAVVGDLTQLAIGFANGAVTLVRGDLIHDRGARQRTIFECEEPITGIEFREGKITALYISTTARILTLILSGRGQGQPARTLDDTGCNVGCLALDSATRDVIVGRNDAIYYYTLHARASSYNCDGDKTALRTYKDYLGIAFKSATSAISRSTLATFNAELDSQSKGSSTVVLLNPDFSFIAHTHTLSSQLRQCFHEWGYFFTLTIDGKLHRYREKSFADKLEILFSRTEFVLAIQMAQKAGLERQTQSMIFRRYGDYLYQRKDYDTAMQQYLRAIETTDPSKIIRKYLDTQRIFNLIDYLEELHETGKANPDHTTLLLNCYAKLQNTEKLEAFIKNSGSDSFDLETVINLCRQGGYFDQAAYLARKYTEHDLVVSILVEDSKRYAEALAYVWRLDPETAYRNLTKYATVFLEHCSDDATQLFTDYYTGNFKPKQDAVIVTETPVDVQSEKPGFASQATTAVQNLASLIPLPYMPMSSEKSNPEVKTETRVIESTTEGPPPKYDIPRPRVAFSGFIDHPQEFVRFLEACLKSGSLESSDAVDVYTTLFEMYLRKASESEGQDKTAWEKKAKNLIDGKDIPIDTSNVLLLSHLQKFQDGTLMVREKQGLRFDIFRAYSTANDTQGVIKALHKYGGEEPQLYPAALVYFTSSQKIFEEAGDEVNKTLRRIDADGLMAPLQVIQTLSINGVATMGLIKKYLSETIGKEKQEIDTNRKTIDAYRQDSEKKQAAFKTLTTQPTVFNATRCKSCGYALDQPTVHFLCEHSFHQRCLNVTEDEGIESVECPVCAAQNANVRAIRRAQEEYGTREDLFRDELARSKDGFEVIAKWFGRGVMSSSSGSGGTSS